MISRASPRLRTVIVDDEPLARRRLRALLAAHSDVEVVAECADGPEAVAAITRERPDLVFLDVQMPEGDGFSVVRAVGVEQMPTVVFVTAYDQYALDAFEVHALDYLLKPFDEDRFVATLERVRLHHARVRAQESNERLMALLERLPGGAAPSPKRQLRTPVRSPSPAASSARSRSTSPLGGCGETVKRYPSARRSSTCCSRSFAGKGRWPRAESC